jgi:hypothetical protein
MCYVIQRKQDLKFLAKKGSLHSYSHQIEDIAFFTNREDAEREKLQDEKVIHVRTI